MTRRLETATENPRPFRFAVDDRVRLTVDDFQGGGLWTRADDGSDQLVADRIFPVPQNAVCTVIAVEGQYEPVSGDGQLVLHADWTEDNVSFCTLIYTWTDQYLEKI